MNILKYLTEAIPGIGGKIKQSPEDFIVEEIPLYQPIGEGTHTYFEVEKRGIATLDAVRRIANALGVNERAIGYAGLKDAQAVTKQIMSVEHIPCRKVLALKLPNIQINWAKLHQNKLRVGHLWGNRFRIKIRDVQPNLLGGKVGKGRHALKRAQKIIGVLTSKGVPNYFGAQRFGIKGDSDLIGKAIIQRDWQTALDIFLGHPSEKETEKIQHARKAYEAGDFASALKLFPRKTHFQERRALSALIKNKDDILRAFFAIPEKIRRLFVSAYQSELFNRVIAARIPHLDKLHYGDLAMKHDNNAVFLIENPELEQPRADRFEISPSGPIYGYKMILPQGEAKAVEEQILVDEELNLESFRGIPRLKIKGARRALRFQLTEFEIQAENSCLVITFVLPSGSYASVVLAELMKPPQT
jgi:tRNA pseudouridine13 synthase